MPLLILILKDGDKMLQRLIDDIIQEAKLKDSENCLLVIQTEAFEQLNVDDFKAKIVSSNEWRISAPSFSKDYDNQNIHVILQKSLFQKADVDDNGYFLYKGNLWRTALNNSAYNKEYGYCSFEEGLHGEDWITSDEIIPIKNEDVENLILQNIDTLVSQK